MLDTCPAIHRDGAKLNFDAHATAEFEAIIASLRFGPFDSTVSNVPDVFSWSISCDREISCASMAALPRLASLHRGRVPNRSCAQDHVVAAISVWLWVQNVVFFLHDLEAWELANELRDRCDVVDERANHAHASASCTAYTAFSAVGSYPRLMSFSLMLSGDLMRVFHDEMGLRSRFMPRSIKYVSRDISKRQVISFSFCK